MRLLVVGAGATGGYFGGRLAHAGRDVTFLVRAARAAQIRDHGLTIISPRGDLHLKPKLMTADAIAGPFDVILVTVKAFALTAARSDFAAAVGPKTIILPVLNGMKHLDVLAERFGARAVIGGVCKIAATVDAQGQIVQLAKFHELAYGETDGRLSARIEALDQFMQGAEFDAHASTNIILEMWQKWLFLASLGVITCLMRVTVGEVAKASGGKDFVRRLLDEITLIVKAANITPDPNFLVEISASLTAESSPLTSSMYRDLQKGSPIEADQIVGDLLARGKALGVETPLLAAAYTHLCVYQNRLGK
ncbi:MAG: 2-dehydropantoate 2-reductase [Methylovirgula sp.]|jgi:2-dehydropantoate 2-reductase